MHRPEATSGLSPWGDLDVASAKADEKPSRRRHAGYWHFLKHGSKWHGFWIKTDLVPLHSRVAEIVILKPLGDKLHKIGRAHV